MTAIPKHKRAKEQAEHIFKTYALTTPVRVFELAEIMGIHWKGCTTSEMCKIVLEKEPDAQKDSSFADWNEVLAYYDKEEKTIYINNETQPITRTRFTFAHEIGHHQLHAHLKHNHFRHMTILQDIYAPSKPEEVEANYFAGYLLMPDAAIIRLLEYTDVMPRNPDHITRELAKMLAVSPESMRIRLQTFKKENPDIWEQYHMDEKIF
ncbi:MAG: ImmA/IrrE family metallo-endopeptidase [Patescibacteria group bacterium]